MLFYASMFYEEENLNRKPDYGNLDFYLIKKWRKINFLNPYIGHTTSTFPLKFNTELGFWLHHHQKLAGSVLERWRDGNRIQCVWVCVCVCVCSVQQNGCGTEQNPSNWILKGFTLRGQTIKKSYFLEGWTLKNLFVVHCLGLKRSRIC